ncbi:MAG: hypothetical protein AAF601_05565 [Pseudomonadota bacterium]
MIKTLLISISLVGASAAGAIALASLHSAIAPQIARLAEPEPKVVPVKANRFVAPSYVPVPTLARVTPNGLPNGPAAVGSEPLVLTPFATTADPSVLAPSVDDDLIPPQHMTVPTPAPQRVVAPKPTVRKQQVAHIEPTDRSQRPSKRAKLRPVIVAQSPSFLQSGSASAPDYVIGVYR